MGPTIPGGAVPPVGAGAVAAGPLAAGATFATAASPLPAGAGVAVDRVDLNALLQELARREVNEVLVEAGAALAGAFVEQRLVDQWICYMAPKLMGSAARPVLALDIPAMSSTRGLHLTDLRQIGQDIRMTYGWSD